MAVRARIGGWPNLIVNLFWPRSSRCTSNCDQEENKVVESVPGVEVWGDLERLWHSTKTNSFDYPHQAYMEPREALVMLFILYLELWDEANRFLRFSWEKNGEPSSARCHNWSRIKVISFIFNFFCQKSKQFSFSSGTCTATWRWRLPIVISRWFL